MNSPHGNAFMKVIQKNKKQFLASWYIFHFQMPCIPEWIFSRNDYARIDEVFNGKVLGLKTRKFDTTDIQAFKANMCQPGALTAAINYYRCIIRFAAGTPNRGHIKMPTLLLWGTADGALTMETAEETKNYCDDLTLIYHDGISHWVQQDDPITVNANMDKFLSK